MRTIALLLALVVVAEAAPQQPWNVKRSTKSYSVPNFPYGPPVPTSNGGAPLLQTLIVRDRENAESRRLLLHVPRDRNGNRYFYTRTLGGQPGTAFEAETTTETWLDSLGLPLRTRYVTTTPSETSETEVIFRIVNMRREAVFTHTETKVGKKPIRKEVVQKWGDLVECQFASFYPGDLATDLDGRGHHLRINPVTMYGDSTWVEKMESGSQPGMRYRLRGLQHWEDIELDEQGRVRRWSNDDGLTARPADPIPGEMETLEKMLANALGLPAKASERSGQ
jgi:hypothetical protein